MSKANNAAAIDKACRRLDAIIAGVQAMPAELAHEARHRILLDLEDVADALAAHRMNVLRDELATTLPRIGDGSPNPDGSMAHLDPGPHDDGRDLGFDFEGPTPDEVLGRDRTTAAPSVRAAVVGPYDEADQIAVHGCA